MRAQHDFVFWLNSISAHQAPFIRALADDLGASVLVVVPPAVSAERHGFGWEQVHYGSATVSHATGSGERLRALEANRGATAHVFFGLGAYPEVTEMHLALADGPHGMIAVMSESWDARRLRGALRNLRFRRRMFRLGPRTDLVFTIGELARRQFGALGFGHDRIAPFGYSVDEYPGDPTRRLDEPPEFTFVGSMNEWKDPLAVIEAFSRIGPGDARLTMIGDGPLLPEVERTARQRGVEFASTFIPRMPQDQVRRRIADSDLLVLPSRYDGWGAVVNEALMSGTPAGVSTVAGASTLVVGEDQGFTLRPGDLDALTAQLAARALAGRVSRSARARLTEWSRRSISPQTMARHFCRQLAIDAPRIAPWNTTRSDDADRPGRSSS